MRRRLPLVLLAALVVPFVPAGAQEDAPDASWPDPAGDAKPLFGSTFPAPGLPSNPATDHVDLTRLSFSAENETHVTLTLTVVGFHPDVEAATMPFGASFYSVAFSLNGAKAFFVQARYHPAGDGGGFTCCPPDIGLLSRDGTPLVAWLYERVEDPDGFTYLEQLAALPAVLDEASGSMSFILPRSELRHANGVPGHRLPQPADRLTEIRAFAGTSITFISDALPDAGTVGDLVFALPSADDVLSIEPPRAEAAEGADGTLRPGGPGSSSEASGERGIPPGATRAFPLVVTNRDSVKRIVNLTASLHEGAPSDWKTTLVPNLQVASNESVTANLIVQAGPNVGHRDSALIRVRGFLLGRAEQVGVEEIRVFAVRSPGPGANVLHLHSATRGAADPVDQAFQDVSPDPHGWMNLADEDPSYPDPDVPLGVFSNRFDGYAVPFQMDTPLGANLRFDTERKVSATLAYSAEVEVEGDLEVQLYAGDRSIASGSLPVTIGPNVASFTLDLPVPRSMTQVNATEGRLELVTVLRPELSGVRGFGVHPAQPVLVVKDSSVTLPLLDPGTPEISASTGTFLPTLSFRGARAAEAYVNPERTTIFNVSLVNEGTGEDAIRLRLNVSRSDWAVELRPATSFRLASGEKANLSLWVKPPRDAKEGDAATIEIVATSGGDPAARGSLKATATATLAIDIPDEAWTPVVEKAEKKSPAGPLVAVPVALLLAVLCRRRRQ